MDFNFGDFFNDAGKKAQEALDDLVKVGKPALLASLEQQGIDTLNKMLKGEQQNLNAAVKEVTAKDPAPGSFGAALSSTVQGSVFQVYGMQITIGIVALILIGFMLRGK